MDFELKDNKENLNVLNVENMSRVFKILGDKNRLQLVLFLERKDMCVHELTKMLGISQSLVSHQLRILRDADIVRTSRRGNEVVYNLADDHISKLLEIVKEHIEEEGK